MASGRGSSAPAGGRFPTVAPYVLVPTGTTVNTSTTSEMTAITAHSPSVADLVAPDGASRSDQAAGGQILSYGPVRYATSRQDLLGEPSGSSRDASWPGGAGDSEQNAYGFTQVNHQQTLNMEVDQSETNFNVLLQQLNVAATGADPALLDQAYQALLAAREETHHVTTQATRVP